MNTAQQPGMAPAYEFYMEANSTNGEAEGSQSDNIIQKSVHVWVETDLTITGVAVDSELHYNVSEYVHIKNATKEAEIGPQIVNMYEIRNNGPSTIEETEIFILVPHETIAGDGLMYLLNQPETSGNIRCDPTSYANEHNFELDAALSTQSFLERQGATTSYSSRRTGSASSSVSGSGSGSGSTFTSSSSSSSWSSSNSGHHGSGGSGRTQHTEEERRKIDAEENMESTGDASFIHRDRAGQIAHSQMRQSEQRGGGGGNVASTGNNNRGGGGYAQQSSSTWSTSSQNGGPAVTYSASRNRTIVHDANGNARVYDSHTGGNVGGGGSSSSSARYQGSSSASAGSGGRNRSSNQMYKLDDIDSQLIVNKDITAAHQSGGNVAGSSAAAAAAASSSSASASSAGRRRMMSQQDGDTKQQFDSTGLSAMEKAAQGGRGFQTSSVDLGTLTRDNVDNDLRGRSNVGQFGNAAQHQQGRSGSSSSSSWQSGGNAAANHHQQQHYSGSSQSSGGGSHHSSNQHHFNSAAAGHSGSYGVGGTTATNTQSSVDENVDDGYEYTEEYEYPDEEDDHQSNGNDWNNNQNTYQSHSSSSSSSNNGGSGSGRGQYANSERMIKDYQRIRRQADVNDDIDDLILNDALRCNRTKCAILRCVAGPLEKDSNAWISIRARLVAHTMHMVSVFFFNYSEDFLFTGNYIPVVL